MNHKAKYNVMKNKKFIIGLLFLLFTASFYQLISAQDQVKV